MMGAEMEESGMQARSRFNEVLSAVAGTHEEQLRAIARTIIREPFARRAWSELAFLSLGAVLGLFGIAFVVVTLSAGVVLAITFFGLGLIALSVRGARGFGGFHRQLARSYLDEEIDEPEAFSSRPGFLGWLQSSLRDRTGWRSMAYMGLKVPLATLGILAGFAFWWDAFFCLTFPLWGGSGNSPAVYGLPQLVFGNNFFSGGHSGFLHEVGVFLAGLVFFFAAPWAVRAVVSLDRLVLRVLLAPDPVALRVRSLEQARAQTVDASAATLRRIERDLHDGTQAQLVALAMRLGMAKEKLAEYEEPAPDQVGQLDQVRQLVDDAHRSAKEAIVELRDLARGIHPPALDIGLEGALATLAARSTVATDLSLSLESRPAPAIEAIAYFCVAELLANVAQHAHASSAIVTCTEHGQWLRVVVRDDGTGGAQLSRLGSSSSGLAGLTDRVHAVDGRLDIASPPRGPTVVTVDLPLHV
ncbi:MAG TPA: sensor domain-containing protein [Acidimicrobiales bacterium]|nr:sensor domain-containing protein [Acidimicrobiales bacterium]